VLLPCKVLLDLDCLDNVARCYFVTLVNTLIDDERHTRELLGSRFKDCDRKRHVCSAPSLTSERKRSAINASQITSATVCKLKKHHEAEHY